MPHHHCNRPKSVHHPHSSIDDDEWSSKNLTMYATFLKSICQSAFHLQSQCTQSFLSKYLSATHNNKAHLRKYISTTSSLLLTIQVINSKYSPSGIQQSAKIFRYDDQARMNQFFQIHNSSYPPHHNKMKQSSLPVSTVTQHGNGSIGGIGLSISGMIGMQR